MHFFDLLDSLGVEGGLDWVESGKVIVEFFGGVVL